MILSLLLPAYGYKDGLINTLDAICSIEHYWQSQIEVIVSENIVKESIFKQTEIAFYENSILNFTYTYFDPKCSAPENWNYLLSIAKGEYLWLLHHDERPLNMPLFLPHIVTLLRSEPDLVICELIVEKKFKFTTINITLRKKHHLWPLLKGRLLYSCPEVLAWCNFVGPPSVVIAKKTLNYRYNEGLAWLLDVDAYIRLLRDRKFFRLELVDKKGLEILSDQSGHIQTLTKSLPKPKRLLSEDERKILFPRTSSRVWRIKLIAIIAKAFLHIGRIVNIRITV